MNSSTKNIIKILFSISFAVSFNIFVPFRGIVQNVFVIFKCFGVIFFFLLLFVFPVTGAFPIGCVFKRK